MPFLPLFFVIFLLIACTKQINPLDPDAAVQFAGQPVQTGVYALSCEYSVNLTGDAALYYMALPSGSPVPGPDQVVNGISSGAAPLSTGYYFMYGSRQTAGAILSAPNSNMDLYIVARATGGLTGLLSCAMKMTVTTSTGFVYLSEWGVMGIADGTFQYPTAVAPGKSGTLYVADQYNHRIQKFDSNGNYLTKFGTYGRGDGQLNGPYGIALDAMGIVYVSDFYNHRVVKFAPAF